MGIRQFIGILLLAAASGCGAPQSEQCRSYVACQQAYDEATGIAPVDVSQYLEGGACWDDANNAAHCTEDCERGLALLAEAADSEGLLLPACPDG